MLIDAKSDTIQEIPETDPGRAIYVDFEGTKLDPPSLLGVFYSDTECSEDRFVQYVIEPGLSPAGDAKPQCVNRSLEATLQEIVDLSRSEERMIVAWSSREALAVDRYSSNSRLNEYFINHLIDAKAIAKRWKQRFFPRVRFPYITGQGRHRLAAYMKLTGYPVSSSHGPGNTGQRIRYVRQQLLKRGGDYQALTSVAKAKWTNLLAHNRHDCSGMRHVFQRASEEMRSLKK